MLKTHRCRVASKTVLADGSACVVLLTYLLRIMRE